MCKCVCVCVSVSVCMCTCSVQCRSVHNVPVELMPLVCKIIHGVQYITTHFTLTMIIHTIA